MRYWELNQNKVLRRNERQRDRDGEGETETDGGREEATLQPWGEVQVIF